MQINEERKLLLTPTHLHSFTTIVLTNYMNIPHVNNSPRKRPLSNEIVQNTNKILRQFNIHTEVNEGQEYFQTAEKN